MDKENPLGKDGPRKDVGLHLYRSMIGSLMYLTASIPDIMFTVCACAWHQVTPKESTTKAKYVAAASYCGQVLWIQNQLLDYGLQRQYSKLQAKFQAQEEEIVKLKDRVKVLEDREGVAAKQSRDDAPIKGININEVEAAAKRISNDSEEIAMVLTSMDAATVLAGGIDVPTGSGFIPIAGPPATVISTGSESQQRRPMTKKQKREYYMAVIKSNLGWRFKYFKGITFEEIKAKFAKVWKQVEDFIPMGSKKETERIKRKCLNLENEQVKKQKSSEEAFEIETSTEEFTKEKMKEMMQLVPVEDVYVQALQVKHPIID
uniref:Uncharacterized protein n=1 Tax=Tanacetum cinerariifolium TaxID=118510 RepID=A0A699KPR3_TANCI|nr:hypothetical protein [Tanacetum cinerariifolium]